jgi:hypothetical protein
MNGELISFVAPGVEGTAHNRETVEAARAVAEP